MRSLFLGKLLIQRRGGVFLHRLLNCKNLYTDGSLTEGDRDLVADLHIIGSFCDFAVDGDASAITCLIGDGTAFDESGDLQIFIESHVYNLSKKAGRTCSRLLILMFIS